MPLSQFLSRQPYPRGDKNIWKEWELNPGPLVKQRDHSNHDIPGDPVGYQYYVVGLVNYQLSSQWLMVLAMAIVTRDFARYQNMLLKSVVQGLPSATFSSYPPKCIFIHPIKLWISRKCLNNSINFLL